MRKKIGRAGAVLLFASLAGGAATLVSAAALTSAAETPAAATTTVTVDTGKLRGEAQGEVVSFKGIPFAQPPVGELRWKPPQPVAKWQGVRAAVGYGADCMQLPFPSDAAPLGMKPAEDCLYLNVWHPVHAAAGKQLSGVGLDLRRGVRERGVARPQFTTAALPFARLMVSFSSVSTTGWDASGSSLIRRFRSWRRRVLLLANYAIMDQIAALKWVPSQYLGVLAVILGNDPRSAGSRPAACRCTFLLDVARRRRSCFKKHDRAVRGGRTSSICSAAGLSPAARIRREAIGVRIRAAGRDRGDRCAGVAKASEAPSRGVGVVSGLNLREHGSLPAAATYVGGPVLDGQIMPAARRPALRRAVSWPARARLAVGANSPRHRLHAGEDGRRVACPVWSQRRQGSHGVRGEERR